MSKEIKITCTGADTVPIEHLIPFQGNLKELSKQNHAKLKKSMIDYGFSFPVFVWRNDNKMNLLDGHQRLQTLTLMQGEGWTIPPLPVVWIDALDEKEAKTKLLLAVGQYGKITDEGLFEFISQSSLDMELLKESVELPGIDFDKLRIGSGDEVDLKSIDIKNEIIVEINCENEQQQKNLYDEFVERGLKCRLLTF